MGLSLGYRKRLEYVGRKIYELMKRKGSDTVTLAEAVLEVGLSPHYFKYFVLRYLVEIDPCLEVHGDLIKLREECKKQILGT